MTTDPPPRRKWHFTRWLIVFIVAIIIPPSACLASVLQSIPLPLDDGAAKLAVWNAAGTTEQIKADRIPYWALEEQLRKLPESKLKALFGASVEAVPAGYVLPVQQHASVGFSGLGYRGQMRSYFIPIADLGGVLVYPCGDQDFISAVVLFLKTDADFIVLRTASDYPARRTWDLRRTEAMRKHIQAVLRK